MVQLYAAIWQKTGRQQLLIIFLSIVIAALAAVPLEFQKKMINSMNTGADFDHLILLGMMMTGAILLSLSLKWLLGYRSQRVGEWVIKYIRQIQLTDWIEETRGRNTGNTENRGPLANVVSSESETVGKFVGSAYSEPLLQLGTLLSVVGYIAFNQPVLGLIALLMVVPQALAVILTQRRINEMVRHRVVLLRKAVSSITGSDLAEARESILEDFDNLYDTRLRIFVWKLSVKLFLGIMNAVGLVAVLIIGGWYVIQGFEDVGSIVAATIGLTRIQKPWKDLVDFFRNMSIVHVQFELLRDLRATDGAPTGSS